MNKIPLIIQREYLTRVRKKSFIIMTLLGPVIFAAFIILPMWFARMEDKDTKIIAVVETDQMNQPLPDSVRMFDVIPDKELLKFQYVNSPVENLMKSLPQTDYYAVLHIPYNIMNNEVAVLYTKKQPSLGIEDYITKNINDYLYKIKLRKNNIPIDVLNSAQSNIKLKTIKLEKDGNFKDQGENELKRWLGYAAGFLIYFFIFFFGSQVMRGVIEEKTNRIVEVIISSVKPFQLMAGKIMGIGLIGLTQFFIWIILTLSIVTVSQYALGVNKNPTVESISANSILEAQAEPIQTQQGSYSQVNKFFDQIKGIDFVVVISMFIFYFIAGYILYGSMFAAIGAAADSETDTQQFMLPITIPLALSIILMVNAFSNPEGDLAVIFSIIPLTSPVVMMARIGFEIPISQVVISMAVLIATCLFNIWLAGRVYRTGILMYGKKPTYKEIMKWVRYKN